MTADRPDQPKESPEKRRFRSASLNWLLPNMLTIAGLISGLTGLRFALDELWISATTMIVLAAIFDALDGRMARLLKTTSEFGAALDSLSDAVVFGIVPALTLYLWALQNDGVGGKKPEPKKESWQYTARPEPDRQPKAK